MLFKKKERSKIGLALGAGGARGFCHIGVVEVFRENNIPIDVVTGCSMGALVAGAVAIGTATADMRDIADKVNDFTVFDFDLLGVLGIGKSSGGFAKGERAMKLYKKMVGDVLIEDCPIKLATIATDLKSKKIHTFQRGEVWKAVRASMSIPGVFTPVEEHGMVLVDGGVLNRMPINAARKLGADIVIAVDAVGEPFREVNAKSLTSIIDVSVSLMGWNAAKQEYKDADLVIVPKMGTRSQFRFKNNTEAIEAGREAAIKAMPKILELLKRHK